jgi:putative flippase GtrA
MAAPSSAMPPDTAELAAEVVIAADYARPLPAFGRLRDAMPTHRRDPAPRRPTVAAIWAKFGRFLLVGGTCTLLQYIILAALVDGLALSATLASTIGYMVSSALNYALSYTFTFESAALHRHSLPKYVLINLVGLVLNGVVTYLGTVLYGANYLIAQAAATCVTLLWNFFANLRWTFGRRRERA